MANSVLALADSYDVFSAKVPVVTALDLMASINDFQGIRTASEKQLKSFGSGVTSCLTGKTQQRRHLGLRGLQLLIEQSPDDFFGRNSKTWLDNIIKSKHANLRGQECQCLTQLLARGKKCDELSQYVASIGSQIVSTLIKWQRPETLIEFIRTFPKAAGNSSNQIKSFLTDNIRPEADMSKEDLAELFGLWPFIGGPGKEGMTHRQRWISAITDVNGSLLGLLSKLRRTFEIKTGGTDTNVTLEIASDSGQTILESAHFLTVQMDRLTACLTELIRTHSVYRKSLNLSGVMEAWNQIMSISITDLLATESVEKHVLVSSLSKLLSSVIRMMVDLIEIHKEDLLTEIPTILTLSIATMEDVRSVGDLHINPLVLKDLKSDIFLLWQTCGQALGPNSGLHLSWTQVLPLILREVVPFKDTIALTGGSGPKKQGKKRKRQQANLDVASDGLRVSPPEVCCAALKCLSTLLSSCGGLLPPSVHKDLQGVILSLVSETLQGNLNKDSPFRRADCRCQLLKTLEALVLNPNPKWPPPTQFAVSLFKTLAKVDADHEVRQICVQAVSVMESLIHPRSASFNLAPGLTNEELKQLKEQVMKVHVVLVGQAPKTLDFETEPTLSAEIEQPSEAKKAKKAVVHEPSSEHLEAQAILEETKKTVAKVTTKVQDTSKLDMAEYGITEEAKAMALKTFYDFSKDPIHIPDEAKTLSVSEASTSSKAPLEKVTTNEADDEAMDLEEARALFVPEESDEDDD